MDAWANDRGGAGLATGTQTWMAANIPIQEGVNIITVTAEDSSGNQAVDAITVSKPGLLGLSRDVADEVLHDLTPARRIGVNGAPGRDLVRL